MIAAIVGAVAVVVLLSLVLSLKIVREYQRIVLFRLGRVMATKGPGLVLVNPITDRTTSVDLREQFLEIPHQTAITRDNAPINIDFIIFYKVVDPVMSVVKVQNFRGAALNVAATTLRSVVGDMSLDDVLSKREDMNASLRVRLDEVTERWGVKVTSVEVREINPPAGVQDAMTRQMSAERTRRAAVTEAEGKKQAAILAAEGERQASVSIAEGAKQAQVLDAEGERQAAVLRAEGFSRSLGAIYEVAKDLDSNTLLLQYMETLKQVGASPSTKLVVPMELAGLLSGLRNVLGEAGGTGSHAVEKGPRATADGAQNGTAPPDQVVPQVAALLGGGGPAAPGRGGAAGRLRGEEQAESA
ncbi:MAG: SPFH domain-containing protein [Acidimicrobiales bacterium]